MTCETQAVFTCSSCTMAFALAACHQARGACAVPGLAERGFSMDAHTHRLSPSRLQHSLLLVALAWLLPALPRSETVFLRVFKCMKSHQTWKRSRGGRASPGTAFFLQIFRAIQSTRESPKVNFHSCCISMTSSEGKETFPSAGSQEEPEGCLALVVNP